MTMGIMRRYSITAEFTSASPTLEAMFGSEVWISRRPSISDRIGARTEPAAFSASSLVRTLIHKLGLHKRATYISDSVHCCNESTVVVIN